MNQLAQKKTLLGMLVAALMCVALLAVVAPQDAYAAQGWNHDSKGFWYQYDGNSKHYYKNGWQQIQETYNMPDGETTGGSAWYYFQSNGYAKEGWIKSGKYWYYLYGTLSWLTDEDYNEGFYKNNPQYAKLKDGKYHQAPQMVTGYAPVEIAGKSYIFDNSGRMKTGWVQTYFSSREHRVWVYANGSGALVQGWKKINGKWYYFNKNSYYMASNEWRDGYWLGKNGAWTYKYKGSWHKNSKGWWFGDTSGWYAKNEVVAINGEGFKFDKNGYLVDQMW